MALVTPFMCWKTACTSQKHPPARAGTCVAAPDAGVASRAGAGICRPISAARGGDGANAYMAPNAIAATAASAQRAAVEALRERASVGWVVMFGLRVNRGRRRERRHREVRSRKPGCAAG